MLHQNDFIKLAEELIESDEEVKWRSATSLAYYYAFHAVSFLVKVLPPPEKNNMAKTHSSQSLDFIKIMKSHSDAKYRMMGILLHMCKDLRVRAFYHVTIPFTKEEGMLAIKISQHLAEEVGMIYMYMILPGFALHP